MTECPPFCLSLCSVNLVASGRYFIPADFLVELHEYVDYIFAVYVHTFCNLIGVWKFLNGDTPDVHDSPDPLSLFE